MKKHMWSAIDPERHAAVADKLAIQEADAVRWHNACLLYFQTFSKRPFPPGMEKPRFTLKELMSTDPMGNEAKP
jgi:alpha-glucuronidase